VVKCLLRKCEAQTPVLKKTKKRKEGRKERRKGGRKGEGRTERKKERRKEKELSLRQMKQLTQGYRIHNCYNSSPSSKLRLVSGRGLDLNLCNERWGRCIPGGGT
jgi:hypothetical protein